MKEYGSDFEHLDRAEGWAKCLPEFRGSKRVTMRELARYAGLPHLHAMYVKRSGDVHGSLGSLQRALCAVCPEPHLTLFTPMDIKQRALGIIDYTMILVERIADVALYTCPAGLERRLLAERYGFLAYARDVAELCSARNCAMPQLRHRFAAASGGGADS